MIVNLIGATRTTAGLRVRCELDRGAYPEGPNDLRRADGAPQADAASLPRRLELHHPPGTLTTRNWCVCSLTTPNWEAFLRGLRERSWIEGQNVVIESRYTQGRPERFPELVAEVLRR